MKFNVGDKIRVVNCHSGGNFDNGDIITVEQIGSDYEDNVYGAISPHDGYMWYLVEDEVEPVDCNHLVAECVRVHDKDDYIFYRYEIDGTVIWFSQYKDYGCIYTVSVALPEKFNDFEIYVQDDSRNDIYYPQNLIVRTHKTLTIETMDEYMDNLAYIKKLCEAIMDIFTHGKHKDMYDACSK